MPRACSICGHALSADITKAIAAGGSNRILAGRFGVTPSALQRHRVGCLKSPRQEKKAVSVPSTTSKLEGTPDSIRFDSSDPKALVDATARLVDEALALLEIAKSAADVKTALGALREARDGLQLLMRASGMLAGDGPSIQVDARQQTIALLLDLKSEAQLRELAAGRGGDSLRLSATAGDAR